MGFSRKQRKTTSNLQSPEAKDGSGGVQERAGGPEENVGREFLGNQGAENRIHLLGPGIALRSRDKPTTLWPVDFQQG